MKGEGLGGGGGRQKDKCAAWSPDEVVPGQDAEGRCTGPGAR